MVDDTADEHDEVACKVAKYAGKVFVDRFSYDPCDMSLEYGMKNLDDPHQTANEHHQRNNRQYQAHSKVAPSRVREYMVACEINHISRV